MIQDRSGGGKQQQSSIPFLPSSLKKTGLVLNELKNSITTLSIESRAFDTVKGNTANVLTPNSDHLINAYVIEEKETSPHDDTHSTETLVNLEESRDDTSNDPGKMFVGGLSWQTSAEGLRDYFCKFGDVNECMVMRDPATKRARGFGFITFADPNSVDKVLAEDFHELDGKKIDPKVAFPKRIQPKMIVKTKKVFIGGLSTNSTLEDMKNYFQQYGKIEDAMLMFDKNTQRHRGFGFITFNDDDISDKVCEIHFHEINGKMVECKKAQPKEVMLPVQINKTRAAAARNLYGLAPEQLLAYASYIPRLAPYGNTGVLYPTIFNSFSQSFGLSHSGRSSVNANNNNSAGAHSLNDGLGNSTNGSSGFVHSRSQNSGLRSSLLNPRDLAAVQLAAQQQAVYDAAVAYASGTIGTDYNFHNPSQRHHHSHHGPQRQSQYLNANIGSPLN